MEERKKKKMKALNTIKFIANISVEIEKYKTRIRNAEDIVKARIAASAMRGYIDCALTFLNTMVCTENNDLTADLHEQIDEWHAQVYGTLADKAIELGIDGDYISRLINRRDELMNPDFI